MTSYLVEATGGLAGVAVVLCTDVRCRQAVALPIDLLTEAQRAHLCEDKGHLLKQRIPTPSFTCVGGRCPYLRVDAQVLPGGKGESQEVVALSCFFGVKLHQLPQLLHNLIGHRIKHFQS